MSFAIGQRWISETENSLGLGMITALDFRSVTLHFPATDETRIYAVAQAPLTRIALNKGEQLHHQTGWQGEVLDVQEMNGLLFYLVKNAQGEDVIVNEKELSPIISFSQAKDRLFSSQIDRSEHFCVALSNTSASTSSISIAFAWLTRQSCGFNSSSASYCARGRKSYQSSRALSG